ncbi:MAG: hypothetical protein AMXMBFR83_22780 [Phycisphaerae bacterium]
MELQSHVTVTRRGRGPGQPDRKTGDDVEVRSGLDAQNLLTGQFGRGDEWQVVIGQAVDRWIIWIGGGNGQLILWGVGMIAENLFLAGGASQGRGWLA